MLSLVSRGGFQQKYENVVKKILTVISNDQGFKLFTLNQVIDEVNCSEQPCVTFPGIFFKVIHQREVIENFVESVQCRGTILLS